MSLSVPGPTPENDARGLDPEYLRNEASKSLFLHAIYLMLGANCTMLTFWLAFQAAYGSAVLLAVLASILWRNAISEAQRSTRLYIAANIGGN